MNDNIINHKYMKITHSFTFTPTAICIVLCCAGILIHCDMNDQKPVMNLREDISRSIDNRSGFDSTRVFYSKKSADESIRMTLSWKSDTVIVVSKDLLKTEENHVTQLISHSDWVFTDSDTSLNGPAGYYYIPFDIGLTSRPWPILDTPTFTCICQYSDNTFNFGHGCMVVYDRNTRRCDDFSFSNCADEGGYCSGILVNTNASTPGDIIIYAMYGAILVKANVILED